MEIRLMSELDDKFEISNIYEESWKSAYKGVIPQEFLDSIPKGRWVGLLGIPEYSTIVMLDGVKIIGTSSFCAARADDMKGYGEIISIYFLPEYFNRGYGKQLFQAAVNHLSDMGFNDIYLWVLEENMRARHFYEKFGFTQSGAYLDDNIGGKRLREIQYVLHL